MKLGLLSDLLLVMFPMFLIRALTSQRYVVSNLFATSLSHHPMVTRYGRYCNYSHLHRDQQVVSSLFSSSSHSSSTSKLDNTSDVVTSNSKTTPSKIQYHQEQYNIPSSSTTSTTKKSNENNFLLQPYYSIYYNDVYEVPLPPKHRFPMSKYKQVRERIQKQLQQLQNEKNNDNIENKSTSTIQYKMQISPLVSIQDLQTTHDEGYIHRYLSNQLTDIELRNIGFPWSLEGVNRTLSSVGGTVAAALDICYKRREQLNYYVLLEEDKVVDDDQERKKLGPLFGAHVAGGTHHAFYDYGEGFSVFSDIAVAANVVLRDFPDVVSRILIIDLDVHQGNGNAVLFQNDKRVFTFSMHCKGNYFSTKQKSDLDIELPIGCNDETYLATLNHWLKRIKNEGGKFDFIFYQAGVDIIESDRLGRMDVTGKGLQKRNKMVYNFALEIDVPLIITMGGGYPRNEWEPILSAHSDVYIDAYETLKNQ